MTIAELREAIKDSPDDQKVLMRFFDWQNQEYITEPIEEVFLDSKDQLILT